MAQVNSTVGDLDGNAQKIKANIAEAARRNIDLVIFPELVVTGYPPQDLLHEKSFIEKNQEVLARIIESSHNVSGIVGFVDSDDEGNLYNAAAVFQNNKLLGKTHKTLLPTYDVFDEYRYFKPMKEENIAAIKVKIEGNEIGLGVEICEDMWDETYDIKVTDLLVERGANLIVNISASPFYVGKRFIREELLKQKSAKNKIPIFYTNLVGGQDELVFDGQSMALDATGKLVASAHQFREDFTVTDLVQGKGIGKVAFPPYNREEEVFRALALGIHDYFRKNGFEKAVIGMSGGIDSSTTACLAVEALGRQNVIGLSMPSRFSSDSSKTDAEKLAENLGMYLAKFPIQDIVDSYQSTLEEPLKKLRNHFGTSLEDDDEVADENIQPRVRGNCLMDISNRLRTLKLLVLNTGNKTELALGFCTLYGDMAGGLGALGDVNKLEVYRLAEYVNLKAAKEIVPKNVLSKKPSPELKKDQFDPFDFDIVSPLVDEIIENRRGEHELIEMGYPREIVEDTYRRFRNAEYKRRQAVPCIKITKKAFGIGWKMPIVNKYRG
jgi:NAD+ synthase (glutamine-hydrolysing)